jgi:hypothetical protein
MAWRGVPSSASKPTPKTKQCSLSLGTVLVVPAYCLLRQPITALLSFSL